MTRLEAIKHVRAYIDNALSTEPFEITQDVTLVGWFPEDGDDPQIVAVRSYMMDTHGNRDIIDEDEAAKLASDLMDERADDLTGPKGDLTWVSVGTRGAPTHDEITDVLVDLIEWDASVGPHENAAWDRARDMLERFIVAARRKDHHAKLVALENDRDGAL